MSIKNDIMTLSKATGMPPEILLAIAAANGTPTGDLVVERSKGKKIILPEGMTYEEAIKWCERKIKEENSFIAIEEVIDAYPFDGVIALMKTLKDTYGWTSLRPTPGFFGPNPPRMLAVNVSPTETVQVPWGRIEIPNVEGFISTGWDMKDNRVVFKIGGEVKAKHKEEIHEIAENVRRLVKTDSIYKGKSIVVEFPNPEEEGHFNPWDYQPSFLNVQSVNRNELIFSNEIDHQIQRNVFNLVLNTPEARKLKIPLKRGVLLHGRYGTGKTLTANVLAQMCEENGWTYVYIREAGQLAQAVDFAKRYQPAVIFAEDIDKVMPDERTTEVNEILNVIDGIDSKGTEVMIVLTTNHIEKIQQAMLRPGRLDAVIELTYPDALAAAKLLRLYGRDLIDENEDLSVVGAMLENTVPAVLREVVERSKLGALGRDEVMKITAGDLEKTARSMKAQLKLLEPKAQDNRTNAEKLGDSMGRRVAEAMDRICDRPTNMVRVPSKVST